jgi:F1F0 ATPase subunit 2
MTSWPLLTQIAVSAVIGVALGTAYFYALWLTVTKIRTARRPALVMLTSATLRLAVLFAGLYLIVQGGHWERLLGAVAGIVLARVVLTRALPAHHLTTRSAD